MSKPLRVGIIGANARGGWAADSHVPAVQALAGLELVAVATHSQETADEAAHAFGVAKAYGDGDALIADPDIDLVTVATRVPDHRDLVLAAVAAGKAVYCEWPLGRGEQETRELKRVANSAGVHHAVGLQLRASPAVTSAVARLQAGAVGRVLSVSAFSSTAGFGPDVPAAFVYLEDPDTFANLVTIQGAHTLDLVSLLGGSPTRLSATLTRQFPKICLGDARDTRPRSTFDHLLVHGVAGAGAAFTMEVAGGRQDAAPFWLEVQGSEGSLRLEGGAARGAQASRITLLENGAAASLDEGELAGLADAAVNVGGVYAQLRDDIRSGSRRVAGFSEALELTRRVQAILAPG